MAALCQVLVPHPRRMLYHCRVHSVAGLQKHLRSTARHNDTAMLPVVSVAGFLFQFPGLLIASLAGWGAAKFLRDPADWLIGLTSGGDMTIVPYRPSQTFTWHVRYSLLMPD